MIKKEILFPICLFLCAVDSFRAQNQPLFESTETLQIQLIFPFKDFFNSRTTRDEVRALLVEQSSDIRTKLTIKVRGNTRAKKEICEFPPIQLRFRTEEPIGIFRDQDKLKLITHCDRLSMYENYILKEHLIYQMYNLITTISIRSRLCKITYIDSNNSDNQYVKYAVILEDIGKVADRNKLSSYKLPLRNQESLEKKNLDRLILFEYMVGNLDWSITKQHNIKVLKANFGSLPIGVPYDFDYSGFVDAKYAIPPKDLYVSSVKDRIFRGFCRVDYYADDIQYFLDKQTDIYKLIDQSTYLEIKERTKVKNYITGFYDILENPETRSKNITKACRAKHVHVYQ